MSQTFSRYPNSSGIQTFATFADFPTTASDGTVALARDTDFLYAFNTTANSWILIAGAGSILSMGTFDSGTPSAAGAHIDLNQLIMQSASSSNPGVINIGTQTFAGTKTFTGSISASNLSGTNTGNVTINATPNGLSVTGQVLFLQVATSSLTGALSSTDWNTFNNKQNALTFGNLTDTGTDGITIGSGTGAVIGSGTTISQHVADTTHNGYLSSTDWNTFNSKQAAGNYITALTGDGTASGPGSAALTLATVNGNVGSFGSSTSIPSFTVTAKGLITAATGNVVIAPAGTLSGNTLAAGVTASSLTSLGAQAQALNMNSHLINSVTDPLLAQDAATKNYVDTVASQLQPLQAVQAASTANVPGSYTNGAAGIGATFTTTATTPFALDGVSPALLSRVLLKDQSGGNGFQNGVYTLTTQAVGGVSGAILTRALDYDTNVDINAGDLIPVINGSVNANTSWLQTATVTTVGSDALVFTQWTANPANYLLKANNLSDVASKTTSFNNLSPMTTGGDIIYGGASGAGTRLANGSSGQVLTSNGTTLAPSWQAPSGATLYSWIGYHSSTTNNTFTVTSNGFADFTNSGDSTTALTEIDNSNFGTVTSYGGTGASELPGIIFTPGATGRYFVKASFTINAQNGNNVYGIRLTDGTTVLDVQEMFNAGQTYFTVTLSGILNISSLSSKTIKVQGSNSGSGTINMTNAIITGDRLINWSIYRIG